MFSVCLLVVCFDHSPIFFDPRMDEVTVQSAPMSHMQKGSQLDETDCRWSAEFSPYSILVSLWMSLFMLSLILSSAAAV